MGLIEKGPNHRLVHPSPTCTPSDDFAPHEQWNFPGKFVRQD